MTMSRPMTKKLQMPRKLQTDLSWMDARSRFCRTPWMQKAEKFWLQGFRVCGLGFRDLCGLYIGFILVYRVCIGFSFGGVVVMFSFCAQPFQASTASASYSILGS